MSDEAVVTVLENDLDVQAEIIDGPPLADHWEVSHEITADGRVKPLDEDFHFGWKGDE